MTKAYAAWPSSFSRTSPEAIRSLLTRAPFFGRHTTEERLWNFAHPEECAQQRRIRSFIDGPIHETTGYAKLKLRECSAGNSSSNSSSGSSSSSTPIPLPPFETVALNKTLCVSSQAGGCAMGCTFCATGDLVVRRSNNKVNRLRNEDDDRDGDFGEKKGLIAGAENRSHPIELDPWASSSLPSSSIGVTNLPSWAILEQLFWAHYCGFAIEKVVFMGMGEPLLNYANVVTALKVFSEDLGIKCALSTVGVAPRIKQLASDVPLCRLSLSLHATNPTTRAKLLPIASKRWDLDAVLAAVRYHEEATGLAAVLEYTVIQGVNDSLENAKGLKDLIKQHGLKSSVNMIPYNPTNIGTRHGFASATDAGIKTLRDAVRDQGIPCTVRFSTKEGRPIDAACGQLGNKWRKGVNTPPTRLEFR